MEEKVSWKGKAGRGECLRTAPRSIGRGSVVSFRYFVMATSEIGSVLKRELYIRKLRLKCFFWCVFCEFKNYCSSEIEKWHCFI